MAKRKKKYLKGHIHRHRATKLEQTKMKASKALEIIERAANAHIRKWKRRFILASMLLALSIGSLAVVLIAFLACG